LFRASTAKWRLKRPHQSIANGIVELNVLPGERVIVLKVERQNNLR
jgi:hypothetical protein